MDVSNIHRNNLRAAILLIRSKTGVKIICHYETEHKEADTVATPQEGTPEAETILGYNITTLEKLLTPSSWQAEHLYEVTVDDLTFIGCPAFAHDDGSWDNEPSNVESKQTAGNDKLAKPVHEATQIIAKLAPGLSGQSLATSMDSVSTRGSDTNVSGLTMFHVVLVLSAPSVSAQHIDIGTRALYDQVLKPLVKALVYLQAQYRYVESECRRILITKLKVQAKIEPQSKPAEKQVNELEWAFQETVEALSRNNIASLRLHGLTISLQIATEDCQKVLDASDFAKAILFLEDRSRLLREIENYPSAAALAFFITHAVPTKSLNKLATKLDLPGPAILFLVGHLIKWRKARLIEPLHARNTYVLAPDAPLSQLPGLRKEYGRRFPALPSLDKMMGVLGAKQPAQYGSCFPSRAHRDVYMDILAWMVRAKLVVRLSTAGWICMPDSPSEKDNVFGGSSDEAKEISNGAEHDGAEHEQQVSRSNLILDPGILAKHQQRYIVRLQQSLSTEEKRDTFRKLVRHFDGEHAFEDIANIEGLKRIRVEECLAELTTKGCLKTFQYTGPQTDVPGP